eukprot:SAG11_NODE_37844_length_255_cov_0.647436_1_plen_50_part_10
MKGDLLLQLYDIVDKQSAKLREQGGGLAAAAPPEGGAEAEAAMQSLQAEL